MIIDTIDNIGQYFSLGGRIRKALEAVKNTNFAKLEPGRYELDGKELFFELSNYETKNQEECFFEAHKEYVDIQLVVDGEEMMGFASLGECLSEHSGYNSIKDVVFYEKPVAYSKIAFKTNMFAIIWPSDAHMPCVELGAKEQVCKVVFKVRVHG